MLRGMRTSAVVLIVAGALTAPAAGQPAAPPRKQPTPQELDRAREYFKAAEAARRRHEYKDAADSYLAAYALFPDPEFYFDVAEVDRLGGDEAGALTYYRKYLELEPAGRGSAAARTAVAELRRALDAKKPGGVTKPGGDRAQVAAPPSSGRTQPAAAPSSDRARTPAAQSGDRPVTGAAPNSGRQQTATAPGGDRSPAAAATSRSDRPATAPAPGERPQIAATTSSHRPPADTAVPRGGEPPTVPGPRPEPTTPAGTAVDGAPVTTLVPGAPGRTYRLAGLAAGGAGVVTLAIGVGFGIHAKAISDEASRWDMFHQARYDEGQAAQRNMYILTGVGAAALVAGGVLYYLGVRADATAERGAIAVVPAVGHAAVGLTAAGEF